MGTPQVGGGGGNDIDLCSRYRCVNMHHLLFSIYPPHKYIGLVGILPRLSPFPFSRLSPLNYFVFSTQDGNQTYQTQVIRHFLLGVWVPSLSFSTSTYLPRLHSSLQVQADPLDSFRSTPLLKIKVATVSTGTRLSNKHILALS